MKKKTAITSLVLIIVFALISVFLTFFSFRIPFSNYNWNSFVRGMNFGGDISSGISAKYSVSYSGDDAGAKSALAKSIYGIINDYYTEPNVYLEGSDSLFVETGSEKKFEDNERIENVLSLIGTKTAFRIYDYFGTCEEISISHVKNAYLQQIAGTNSLVIQLDKEGTQRLKAISATGFMYIQVNKDDSPIANTSGNEITDGKVYITGGNRASIVATLVNLQCEKTGVSLSYLETKNLSANLGANIGFIVLISLAVVCLAFLIYESIRLKALGALFVFPLAIFVGLYTLFLNILPNVQINVGSLLAIICVIFIYLVFNLSFLIGIKKQFDEGKSASNSIGFAFKAFMKNVLDFSIVLILTFIILIFVGSSSVNSFAYCMVVGLLVNMFVCLVVSRAQARSTIKIFENNLKAVGLVKKEEAENE